MYGLLTGLRIVELPAFVAAPLCGSVLAQLGAEVIRVDPLHGGIDRDRWPLNESGKSLYWAGLNYPKKSVRLDLTSIAGQRLALDLITAPGAGGGIVTCNLPYSWLSYEELRGRRHDSIMLSFEGHPDGRSAVDYTLNAETGLPYLAGTGGSSAPTNSVLPAWDIATGLYGALALAGADRQRQLSGAGCHLKLALADVAYSVMAMLGLTSEAQVTGYDRPAVGNHLYGSFGRDFETADGRRIMLVAMTKGQWRRLVEITGLKTVMAAEEAKHRADFDNDSDRYYHREMIAQHLKSWVAVRPYAEIEQRFQRAGICWGGYRSILEATQLDPRFTGTTNPVFSRQSHSHYGSFTLPGAFVRIDGEPRQEPPSAPQQGQDTVLVLKEMLGLNDARIDALCDAGVIGVGDP